MQRDNFKAYSSGKLLKDPEDEETPLDAFEDRNATPILEEE